MTWTTALALSTLTALPGAGVVQTSWEEEVMAQIEAIHDQVAADFDYAADLVVGEVEGDASDAFGLEVTGNATYVVVAVCDSDCGDIDLVIYDEVGAEVASDVEEDDHPVVRPRGEGDYSVEVQMVDCAAATCAYAVQVFRRLD